MLNSTELPNKLINEKSSYLLQHAYNPVNWQPWGEEAFKKARSEGKPIFLSIGYSTCHWCHVMAHETFEAEDAAEILNKYFVPVKVDREERPDVDNVYMTACQTFTGSGGWPLSAFLDADKRPFFVGTYYPKETFKNLTLRIAEIWSSDERGTLLGSAQQFVEMLGKERKITGYTSVEKAGEAAVKYLSAKFDRAYGGFSAAPKFPSPQNLLFLMDNHILTGDKNSLNMCAVTLKAMHRGGMYDHLGGGFSRYSTDNKWLVPHFEKMLYDNALLLLAYCRMYGITNESIYAEIAGEIAAYLRRDMSHRGGAFYTAEDADSEGHEGLFYVFTLNEIRGVLGGDAGEFCGYYNVTEKGNFEGKNILNTILRQIPDSRKAYADACRKMLFDYRAKRIRPHRDEKILTSLNGLAVAALSIAGKLLDKPEYIQTAKRTVEFIDKNLTDGHGGLLSCYYPGSNSKDTTGGLLTNLPAQHARGGTPSGFAEDYAFYIWGLLELYAVTGDPEYLERAIKRQDIFTAKFFDGERGGFYLSGEGAEKLLVRTKELYDSAMPSYNSVSLHNLLRLYGLTDDTKYFEQFVKTVRYFSADIADYPQAYIHSVSALMELKNALPDIHICYGSVCRPPAKTIDELIAYFE